MLTLPNPHLPSESESRQAKELSQRLTKYTGRDLIIRLDGETEPLVIGRGVLELLQEVLIQTSLGRSVTVMPLEDELTTQEAADLLKVSRPFLVGLLEGGQLPFRKVGTHRRVALTDLLHYQAKARDEQDEALRELQEQAQKLEMGY
jgi:excisionase family DNA binding protein